MPDNRTYITWWLNLSKLFSWKIVLRFYKFQLRAALTAWSVSAKCFLISKWLIIPLPPPHITILTLKVKTWNWLSFPDDELNYNLKPEYLYISIKSVLNLQNRQLLIGVLSKVSRTKGFISAWDQRAEMCLRKREKQNL